MSLPPGLAEIRAKMNKSPVKEAKVSQKQRDSSPKRVKPKDTRNNSKPKFDRKAQFSLYSHRRGKFITLPQSFTSAGLLCFSPPTRFFPRLGVVGAKHTGDRLAIHQMTDGGSEELFCMDLSEIDAIYDLDWQTGEHRADVDESDDSGEYEPESFVSFLKTTSDKRVTCTYDDNELENWEFLFDVDRKKNRFVLNKLTFSTTQK